MGQTERIYQIKRWLDAGNCLSLQMLQEKLEVSRATVKRDLAYVRDRLGAPVVFDRERQGWRLDGRIQAVGGSYELELCLREDEVHALLTMQQLLSNLDTAGVLGPHITSLRRRLNQLLDKGLRAPAEVARRIRVLAVGSRRLHLPHFQSVGSALLRRQRLLLHYYSRSNDRTEVREVSPQRLVHYRDNWYLDAWCHLREALRSFSVDAIRGLEVLARAAIDVADEELDEVLGSGYGIFSGKQVKRARLRFTPERARWVAAENLHPNQMGHYDASGYWLLDLPYADPRELIMDIMRYVPDVEVLWPDELADEARRRLIAGLRRMGETG